MYKFREGERVKIANPGIRILIFDNEKDCRGTIMFPSYSRSLVKTDSGKCLCFRNEDLEEEKSCIK